MVPSGPKASFVCYLVIPQTATAIKDKGSHHNIFHPSGPFELPCVFSHRVCIAFVPSVIMKTGGISSPVKIEVYYTKDDRCKYI